MFDDEGKDFLVVRNAAGQHSIWPADLPVPPGWAPVGPPAHRGVCLDWIDEHWTDLRPGEVTR